MSPFEQLTKILSLEKKNKCNNSAVIGGLERFVANWARNNRNSDDPAQSALIDQIVASLQGYDKDAGAERADKLDRALALTVAATPAPAPRTRNAPSKTESSPPPPPRTPRRPSRATASRAPEPPPPDDEEDESDDETPVYDTRAGAKFGLDAPVTRMQGVGAARARLLEKIGVSSVRDLLYLFPYRYEDYSRLKTISELLYGEEATFLAHASFLNEWNKGARLVTKVELYDSTGSIQATFFNQPFLKRQLTSNQEHLYLVHGRVERSMSRLSMMHPELKSFSKEDVGIQPVYPLTEGLTVRWMRKTERNVVRFWAGKVSDPLPADIRERAQLLDLETALREIHFPSRWERIEPARRRLAFEELFVLQMGILRQRQKWRSQPGRAFQIEPNYQNEIFPEILQFRLTGAQERAIGEILKDMQKTAPMHRLLQGDVGSGKTVVALAAMLVAVRNGAQAALMAPTEILATQHYMSITRLLERPGTHWPSPPRVALLIGSLKPSEKARTQASIAAGEVDIVVGTHAQIQEAVEFRDLGMAVIDEQHRFGVVQRMALRKKGYFPHVLVMSATPIPRTMTLTVFGDLDLSVLDEMPPGRQPIRTKWLAPRERERAYAFIRNKVHEGRQAFVICPLIEESETIDAQAAVDEYERLRKEVYPDLRVGLIHGKLRPAEKDSVMSEFNAGAIDVLVATSVVEVGIDVPNATLMLIEEADRFGLAQLHQLRGRIGRGAHQSYCMLLAEKSASPDDERPSFERLRVIEETQDGFRLAEKDLELRGPGEFLGTRQSGLPELRVAKLSDVKLLTEARRMAEEVFEQDPGLQAPEHQLLKQRIQSFWKGEGDLS